DLDLSMLQRPEETVARLRIRLRLRNHEGGRPRVASPCGLRAHRAIGERGVALEPGAAILGRVQKERPARRRLVAYDVTVRPVSARPERREIPRHRLCFIAAARAELVEGNV